MIAGIGADLSVQKSVDAEQAIPGTRVIYRLIVRNDGPSPIVGAPVTDIVPAALQNVTWFCTGRLLGATCRPPVGDGNVDTLLDLLPGTSMPFVISGTLDPSATGVLENTAMVAPPEGAEDVDLSNNSSTVTTDMVPESDLSITKTGPAAVLPGASVEYTIVVANAGPSTAADVVVADPMLAGLAFVSTGGDCVTAFPCALGAIPPGESRTITATYTVLAGVTSITNVATLASPTIDPTPDDETAVVGTIVLLPTTTTTTTTSSIVTPLTIGRPTPTTTSSTVPAPPTSTTLATCLQADLSLTKVASPAQAGVGDTLTYTLVVTNAGPATATAVTLTDPLPAAVTLGSATITQGTCAGAGGTVTCAVGALAAGASATATIAVTRTGDAAFTNTAVVSAAEADPDPQNDSATAATAAARESDCGNCQDDDGDGLVDAEDPDCCTPQPLTVTSARYRAPRSRLRVTGTIAGGSWTGVDPRRQDVRLQMRDANGSPVCCTLDPRQWQRLFGRTFGFYDQRMAVCPNVQCVKLSLPPSGRHRTTVILGRMSPRAATSPMQFTLSTGGRCTQGAVTLRSRKGGGAAFP